MTFIRVLNKSFDIYKELFLYLIIFGACLQLVSAASEQIIGDSDFLSISSVLFSIIEYSLTLLLISYIHLSVQKGDGDLESSNLFGFLISRVSTLVVYVVASLLIFLPVILFDEHSGFLFAFFTIIYMALTGYYLFCAVYISLIDGEGVLDSIVLSIKHAHGNGVLFKCSIQSIIILVIFSLVFTLADFNLEEWSPILSFIVSFFTIPFFQCYFYSVYRESIY